MHDITGNDTIKKQLENTIKKGCISHSNLFIHPQGIGEINIALNYISEIFREDLQEKYPKEKLENTISNIQKLNHPDMHYIFPTVGAKSKSIDFIKEWKKYILDNKYISISNWFEYINAENKQGKIGIDDANYIKEIISLHSYENSYKVFIIWHSEKMNIEASNKLLKILEESNNKTIFILLTTDEENIISTIYSRARKYYFKKISKENIYNYLKNNYENYSDIKFKNISNTCNGNMSIAIDKLSSAENIIENIFIDWMRTTFKIKNKISELQNIFNISQEFKALGREKQKDALTYFLEIFRNAFLHNKEIQDTNYSITNPEFNFNSFSGFINNNISEIYNLINESINKINRNLSPELVFTELSINISRIIHRK